MVNFYEDSMSMNTSSKKCAKKLKIILNLTVSFFDEYIPFMDIYYIYGGEECHEACVMDDVISWGYISHYLPFVIKSFS